MIKTRPNKWVSFRQPAIITIIWLLVFGLSPIVAQQLSAGRSDDAVKLRVNLINLNISVLDPDGRFVRGLSKDNFEIYEDKTKQTIDHFTFEDLPISMGFVFDLSGSMKNKAPHARAALKGFLQHSHPDNELFLIGFNDQPELLTGFTKSDSDILNQVALREAKGKTALIDAVYMGVEKLKQGRHQRKVLVVISDGQDNSSRYTDRELSKLVKESDITIFSIGTTAIWRHLGFEDFRGMEILNDISSDTGGVAYFPRNFKQMGLICQHISLELRNQYSIAYVPTDAEFDGKWRKLKVRLNGLKDGSFYALRTRRGYYARP